MILAASDLKSAEEVAAEVTGEVNRVAEYFQEHLPALIGFGMRVVLAFVFFLAGRVVIRWIQRIVKHSLQRTSADQGRHPVRRFSVKIQLICAADFYDCYKAGRGIIFCSGTDCFCRGRNRPGAAGQFIQLCGRRVDPAAEAICGRRLYN